MCCCKIYLSDILSQNGFRDDEASDDLMEKKFKEIYCKLEGNLQCPSLWRNHVKKKLRSITESTRIVRELQNI